MYPGQMTDQQMAEEAIEMALYDLRSDEPMSEYNKERRRKTIRNEVFFLRQEHPDSYILQPGFDLTY